MNYKSLFKITTYTLTTFLLSGTMTNLSAQTQSEVITVVNHDANQENDIRILPVNYIGLSGGFAWLTNEIILDNNKKLNKTPTGYNMGLEYTHLWKLKKAYRPFYLGLAFNALFNRATVGIPRNGANDANIVIMNYYIGTGCKTAYKTNKGFIWHSMITLGFAKTDDDFESASGFGIYSEIGCDYMIGKHWALGATIGNISSYYPKSQNWPSDIRHGIDYNGVHFKMGYFF